MTWLETCFWFSVVAVLYVYVGYPLLVAVAAEVAGKPLRRITGLPESLSIVLAAHNEEASIERRIGEFSNLIASAGIPGEIIVVSDGSTDHTAALARADSADGAHVIELAINVGKAAALTAGCAAASGEILVFADIRQSWAADALKNLLENFRDPAVSAVSGNLLLESSPGLLAGVGAYWLYEKWLRTQESRLHSLIGATGAISAVRRDLFRPIPKGTLLDDVYWPLQVAMHGRRVVHDGNARAYDRLPESPRDEFRRKVRTLCGNFQLLTLCPGALLPWRNPVWLQFLSHKVLRLPVPWTLLAILGASIALPGPLYRIVLWCQLAFYLLGVLGMQRDSRRRFALTNAASSFLVLNSAAWMAFWLWIIGKAGRTWTKAIYETPSLDYSRTS